MEMLSTLEILLEKGLSPLPMFCGLVLLGIGYVLLNFRRPKRFPPGPPIFPVVGSSIFFKNDVPWDHAFQRCSVKYGDVFSFVYGNNFFVVISSAHLVKQALELRGIECAGRPRRYRIAKYYARQPGMLGLVDHCYSEEWLRQKTNAIRLLSDVGMGSFSIENKIKMELQYLTDKWLAACLSPFEMRIDLNSVVTNIFCHILFGIRYGVEDPEFHMLQKLVTDVANGYDRDIKLDYIKFLRWHPCRWQTLTNFKQDCFRLIEFIDRKIDRRRQRIDFENPRDFTEAYLKELSRPQADGRGIKEDWLAMLVADFFISGIPTVVNAVRRTLLYLRDYPDMQVQLQQEVDKAAGLSRSPSLCDRPYLPYTEACVMEAERMSPPMPVSYIHSTICDVELGDYNIPRDTSLIIHLSAVMRDPRVWPDPNSFKPERFIRDGRVIRPPHWMPFSIGQRACPGEDLAQRMVVLTVASVLQSFKLRSATKGQVAPDKDELVVLENRWTL